MKKLLTLKELRQTTAQERDGMSPDDANYYIGLIMADEFPTNPGGFETEEEAEAYKLKADRRYTQLVQNWPSF